MDKKNKPRPHDVVFFHPLTRGLLVKQKIRIYFYSYIRFLKDCSPFFFSENTVTFINELDKIIKLCQ